MSVSDEAVNAAALGMFAYWHCDEQQKLDVESDWLVRLDDHDREEYRNMARAALEAAAPFLAGHHPPNGGI